MTFINPYPVKGFELRRRTLPAPAPKSRSCSSKAGSSTASGRAAVAERDRAACQRDADAAHRRHEDRSTDSTKILLAPSKWEEAWGRVASEAHCSGIPVVGSRRGGLPEAIGEGGIVLDYDAPLDRLGRCRAPPMGRRAALHLDVRTSAAVLTAACPRPDPPVRGVPRGAGAGQGRQPARARRLTRFFSGGFRFSLIVTGTVPISGAAQSRTCLWASPDPRNGEAIGTVPGK